MALQKTDRQIWRGLLIEYGGWLVLALMFGIFNYALCFWTEKTTVSLQLKTETAGILQIYWRTHDAGYSEKQSAAVKIEPHISSYNLKIPAPCRFSLLRIDPLDKPGKMVIAKIVLNHPFYHPEVLDLAMVLDNKEIAGLANLSATADGGLVLASADNDPWLVVKPGMSFDLRFLFWWLAASLIIGSSHFFFFNQRILKGEETKGMLWFGYSKNQPLDYPSWLAILHRHLDGVKLVKATETMSEHSYCFTFSKVHFQNVPLFLAEMRRHYPAGQIRLQLHRSGEV